MQRQAEIHGIFFLQIFFVAIVVDRLLKALKSLGELVHVLAAGG